MTLPALYPVLAFFGNFGTTELIVIAIIALLLFGARLPMVMRNLGRGVTEFKKGIKGIEDDLDDASNESKEKPKIDESKTDHAASQSSQEKVKESQ